MIVSMFEDLLFVLAELSPEQISCHPIMFFSQDLLVDILENLELYRIGCSVRGFNAVHHAPTDSMNKVSVKETNRLVELPRLFILPFSPLIRIHVAGSHSAALVLKKMQAITAGGSTIPKRGSE